MVNPVITIDGPAAVGKSTVARALAQEIGYLYVDSGALYRCATLLALRAGIDTSDSAALAGFADEMQLEFVVKEGRVAYSIEGREPGDAIRTDEVNRHVSPVSAAPEIRQKITQWLRNMRELGSLVVEGRDIGSVVYPDSPTRFYLDAKPEIRARRRHAEEVEKGLSEGKTEEEVMESILRRDQIDSTRKAAPLSVPDGATVIDSSYMTAVEVVATIKNQIEVEKTSFSELKNSSIGAGEGPSGENDGWMLKPQPWRMLRLYFWLAFALTAGPLIVGLWSGLMGYLLTQMTVSEILHHCYKLVGLAPLVGLIIVLLSIPAGWLILHEQRRMSWQISSAGIAVCRLDKIRRQIRWEEIRTIRVGVNGPLIIMRDQSQDSEMLSFVPRDQSIRLHREWTKIAQK